MKKENNSNNYYTRERYTFEQRQHATLRGKLAEYTPNELHRLNARPCRCREGKHHG